MTNADSHNQIHTLITKQQLSPPGFENTKLGKHGIQSRLLKELYDVFLESKSTLLRDYVSPSARCFHL